MTLAVFLNYANLPVERFALPLVVALGLAAIGMICVQRPPVPWRRYAPYACILGLVVLLNGMPYLHFGFDWVSVSNNDQNSYANDSYRLLHHGFWSVPPLWPLVSNAYSWALSYYVYAAFQGGFYHGYDTILALVSALTGLNTYQIYMPVMGAGLLSLVSASGALLINQGLGRVAPIIACFATGLSSQITLAYMYQLGPQEVGMLTFVACVCLLMDREAFALRGWSLVGYAAVTGLVLTGFNLSYNAFQIMLYPCLLAFVVLMIIRHKVQWKSAGRFYLVVAFFMLAITNVLMLSVKSTTLFSLRYTGGKLIGFRWATFPFYVVPSGLANFWGLYPIGHLPGEPFLSLGIAIGGLLLIGAVAIAYWLAWRGLAPAIVTAAIFGLLAIAAIRKGDFALFKLTMYIQPFLWATLTAACFTIAARMRRSEPVARWKTLSLASAPIVALTILGLNAQHFYIFRSEDMLKTSDNTFVVIPHASSSHLLTQLAAIRKSVSTPAVILDTDSPGLAIYESYYMFGVPDFSPSANAQQFGVPVAPTTQFAKALQTEVYLQDLVPQAKFRLEPEKHGGMVDTFVWYSFFDLPPLRSVTKSVLVTTPQLTVLNRSHIQDTGQDVVLLPRDQLANHLVLMNGSLGADQVSDPRRTAALYDLNDDYFYPGRTYSAVGRYLLFYVMNPTKAMRFVVDMTASIIADGKNKLPPAVAIGERRYKFHSVGRGSARLFSPPLEAQQLLGHAFVAIDMGSNGVMFPNPKTGLMRLYGLHEGGDPRRFVGFARNISLISDEEYQHLSPPSELTRFPQDLSNENLEYSGIYDDGWASENSYAILRASTRSAVEVSGMIPEIHDAHFHTRVALFADGHEIAHRIVGVGPFAISAGDLPPGRHRISLRFSGAQRFPNGDNRIVSALLSRLALEPARAAVAQSSRTPRDERSRHSKADHVGQYTPRAGAAPRLQVLSRGYGAPGPTAESPS